MYSVALVIKPFYPSLRSLYRVISSSALLASALFDFHAYKGNFSRERRFRRGFFFARATKRRGIVLTLIFRRLRESVA